MNQIKKLDTEFEALVSNQGSQTQPSSELIKELITTLIMQSWKIRDSSHSNQIPDDEGNDIDENED